MTKVLSLQRCHGDDSLFTHNGLKPQHTHTESRKAKQHPFKVFIWRPTSGPASLVFLTPKRRLPFEGKTKRVLKIRDHDAHVHLSALKNT